MKKLIFGLCFALSVSMVQTTAFASVNYAKETSTTENSDFEYYEGKVTSGVNVRQGAGADKEKVQVDGKGVSLSKGTIVTIIDTVNVGDKPWYQIKFTYKNQELTGYATSTYIKKTGIVITPTPIPEPTATPTPEVTPTQKPTKNAEDTVTQVPTTTVKESDLSSNGQDKTGLYIVLVLALVASGCGLYMSTKKKREKELANSNEISEKVAKLKDMVITIDQPIESKKTKNTFEEKRKPEVRVFKGDKIVARTDLINQSNEVYVLKKDEAELEFAATADSTLGVNQATLNESEEKKELRRAVNNLKEHDIIIHKYFGKGEVYDNSDVKLIEIRFGLDARFLNKEQLIQRKLIQITNERRR